MSAISENKQLIVHVATEVIAIGGVYYILSRQINSLRSELGMVVDRIKEHQELMAEQSRVISTLVEKIHSQEALLTPSGKLSPPPLRKVNKRPPKQMKPPSAIPSKEQEQIVRQMILRQMEHDAKQEQLSRRDTEEQEQDPQPPLQDNDQQNNDISIDYNVELAEELSELEEISDVEELKKEL